MGKERIYDAWFNCFEQSEAEMNEDAERWAKNLPDKSN